MELESRMKAGCQMKIICFTDKPVILAAEEWRDVAEQFQSAFEQKKSCVLLL